MKSEPPSLICADEPERAGFDESTVLRERATQQEIKLHKRALRWERTPRIERAVVAECTIEKQRVTSIASAPSTEERADPPERTK